MADNTASPRAGFDPVLALALGACPAMALTANVLSAVGIGLAALAVMVLSNLVIGALRGVIGNGFLAKLVVICFFATAAAMVMNAYAYSVYQLMGMYASVLAVNLMVFHSAEKAGKDGLGAGLVDAVVTGLVFTLVIVCVAAVREVLGSASIAGHTIEFMKNYTVPLLAQAPGGFIVFAIALAVVNGCRGGKKTACAGGVACAAVGAEKEG